MGHLVIICLLCMLGLVCQGSQNCFWRIIKEDKTRDFCKAVKVWGPFGTSVLTCEVKRLCWPSVSLPAAGGFRMSPYGFWLWCPPDVTRLWGCHRRVWLSWHSLAVLALPGDKAGLWGDRQGAEPAASPPALPPTVMDTGCRQTSK